MDEPIGEFMLNNIAFLILAIIAVVLLVLGVLSELLILTRKYMKKMIPCKYDVESLGSENFDKKAMGHDNLADKGLEREENVDQRSSTAHGRTFGYMSIKRKHFGDSNLGRDNSGFIVQEDHFEELVRGLEKRIDNKFDALMEKLNKDNVD